MKIETFEMFSNEHESTGLVLHPPHPPLASLEAVEFDGFNFGAPVYAEANCRLRVELYVSQNYPNVWALYQSDGKPLRVRAMRASDESGQSVFPFYDDCAGAFVEVAAEGTLLLVSTPDGAFLMWVKDRQLRIYAM